MKKVISFCLWGDNPKYTIGAIKNAELAPFIYTGWEVWFYIAKSVPAEIVNELEKTSQVIHKLSDGNPDAMSWRFAPMSDPSVDVFISRDTDSRLNYRERQAVEEWLESDKSLHIMRDHAYHGTPILGGMWGFKGTSHTNIDDSYQTFIDQRKSMEWFDTETFLKHYIYANYQYDCVVHDEFFTNSPFPTIREGKEYVGAPYDANNNLEIEFVS